MCYLLDYQTSFKILVLLVVKKVSATSTGIFCAEEAQNFLCRFCKTSFYLQTIHNLKGLIITTDLGVNDELEAKVNREEEDKLRQ